MQATCGLHSKRVSNGRRVEALFRGGLFEPGTGRVLPRFANIAALAPALSPIGGALALVVLCGVAALALLRQRMDVGLRDR